ncbi:hypothetical protein DFP72DRAFT_856057 [Ephemerocybe angulata]|uniref:Uncharacterized protein n=1 Tax=Ephemerocybe angulata TaxID=980116 RepID=A0A8H6HG26_9AGAR|nr:hypothetical protein DFP72DRAFT_856057 [Tulosesus angulatus]
MTSPRPPNPDLESSDPPEGQENCVGIDDVSSIRRKLPLDVRLEIGAALARMYRLENIEACQSRPPYSTHQSSEDPLRLVEVEGGYVTSIALELPSDTIDLISRVTKYNEIMSGQGTKPFNFWMKHSPFRFLRHLDVSLSCDYHQLPTETVAEMGSALTFIHLNSITFRVGHLDQLVNGVVQWCKQMTITSILISFLHRCPENEWKRPFFPQLLHPFPALSSLEIRTISMYRGKITNRVDLHSLYKARMKGFKYKKKPRTEENTRATRSEGGVQYQSGMPAL